MKFENMQYDPEDIESIMLSKSFAELYPEEREFVMRHVEGEEEYESMRRLLSELHAAPPAEWVEPDAAIRKNLMRSFPRKRRTGLFHWLSGITLTTRKEEQVQWYRRPALRYAMAVLAAAVLVVVFYPDSDQRLAEVRPTEHNAETSPATEEEVIAETADSLLPRPPAQQVPEEHSTERVIGSVPAAEEALLKKEMPEMNAAPQSLSKDDVGVVIVSENANEESMDRLDDLQQSRLSDVQSAKTSRTITLEAQGNDRVPASATQKGIRVSASAPLKEMDGLLDVLFTAR